jgi:hypothetical protein
MKNITNYLALGAIALGFSGAAQAVPTMKISDGISTITISDGGAGDSNASAGLVTWIGNIGVWNINVNTGVTKPAFGNAENPYMDLNFVNGSSSSAGTLTIWFSETDFSKNGTAFAKIGGTAAGTVSYETYYDTANALFGNSGALTNQSFLAGAFSGSVTGGPVMDPNVYSLTQKITITHSQQGISSGDAELTVPDSGSTIALLGAALATLGLISRRRKVA